LPTTLSFPRFRLKERLGQSPDHRTLALVQVPPVQVEADDERYERAPAFLLLPLLAQRCGEVRHAVDLALVRADRLDGAARRSAELGGL
jgi:hypothetical protein